jgi:hypothetical protein
MAISKLKNDQPEKLELESHDDDYMMTMPRWSHAYDAPVKLVDDMFFFDIRAVH